ncbi:hypothetical protein FK535_27630 [Mycolicibacterium sp. 018/SC-01/001]|nr:hypothetical protein FK535_27630 [Mycolicibacterium sp. 018/SC-01/001]
MATADVATPVQDEQEASAATPVAATTETPAETVQSPEAGTTTTPATPLVSDVAPAAVPHIAAAPGYPQPVTAGNAGTAAVGITPGDSPAIDPMTGQPHLTGSQLAAGPVQAVVAPAPVQAALPAPSTSDAPTQAANGPLSAFLNALP